MSQTNQLHIDTSVFIEKNPIFYTKSPYIKINLNLSKLNIIDQF